MIFGVAPQKSMNANNPWKGFAFLQNGWGRYVPVHVIYISSMSLESPPGEIDYRVLTVFITVTLNTKLSILAKVLAHLCDEGVMHQQPVRRRQHRLLGPQGLPKAIPDADLVAFS